MITEELGQHRGERERGRSENENDNDNYTPIHCESKPCNKCIRLTTAGQKTPE